MLAGLGAAVVAVELKLPAGSAAAFELPIDEFAVTERAVLIVFEAAFADWPAEQVDGFARGAWDGINGVMGALNRAGDRFERQGLLKG